LIIAAEETSRWKTPAALRTSKSSKCWIPLESAAKAAGNRREISKWQAGPLADLIAYINDTHHKYTREEISRLGPPFDRVIYPDCRMFPARHLTDTGVSGLFPVCLGLATGVGDFSTPTLDFNS